MTTHHHSTAPSFHRTIIPPPLSCRAVLSARLFHTVLSARLSAPYPPMALLLVQSPLEYNYSGFFLECFSRIPQSCSSAHVLVASPFRSVSEFSHVLLSLYLQVRESAACHGFPPTFEVEVLLRAPGNVYGHSFALKTESCPTDGLVQIDLVVPPTNFSDLGPHGIRPTDVVAVGGTFDHLHDGHKVLLQTTAFCARKHIVVGVTGPALLTKKKYAEALQPLEVRIRLVSQFLLRHLPPHVLYSIYEINDVCGPTGYVRNINTLIISQETAEGAVFVNNYRKERGFAPLDVVLVAVVGGDGSGSAENNWKGKLSSTDFRELEWKRLHAHTA